MTLFANEGIHYYATSTDHDLGEKGGGRQGKWGEKAKNQHQEP